MCCAELKDSQSLGLLRFPSPQLRQQTRLPKFPTVPLRVDFDDNVGDRIAEEDEEEEEDAEDGVVLIDEAQDELPVLVAALPICPQAPTTSIHHTSHHLSIGKMVNAAVKIQDWKYNIHNIFRESVPR